MSRRLKILPRWMALLVLTAGASRAAAQSYYLDFLAPPEPQLTMPQVKYFNLNVEATRTSFDAKSGNTSSDAQQLYVSPTVGVAWNYFLYHPDLLTYSFLLEPGYSWQQYSGTGSSRNSESFIVNGNALATLLKLKPYATMITYNRSHEDFNYDFFNSATGDTERWGINSGYREGPVPTVVTFNRTETEVSGLNYDSTSEQMAVGIQAQNERHNGNHTDLNYQFNQYDSTSTDGVQDFTDSNTSHNLTINDTEHFSRSTLNSSLFYNHIDDNASPSDSASVSAGYDYEHNPQLHSFYNYFFSEYSTDGADAFTHSLSAGLRHQLYDSLSTGLSVHGSESSSDSFGSQLDQYTAGVDASANYSKKLSDWGHLSLSDNAGYNMTSQDSSGGELLVANESHTIDPSMIFFLDRPRETSFISLTDASGTITYVRGSDYDVIMTSDPWQIQIHSGGPHTITSGQIVKANYIIEPNPSGNYSTFNNGSQMRIDFWKGLLAIYVRYNFSDNYSDSAGFVLENIRELQTGGDLNWHRVHLGVIYTDHESSLYDYQSLAFSESYTLLAAARQSASIDFRQQWSFYPGRGSSIPAQSVSYYSFTGRYTLRPFSGLEWNTEAGYQIQHGAGLDQNFIVARSYLSWFVGKLDFHLGYEFENQRYSTETRVRHFVFLHMRRSF